MTPTEARLWDAIARIHSREWPAGDHRAGARHAAEMWAIADEAMQDIPASIPSSPDKRVAVKVETSVQAFPNALDFAKENV